MIHRFCVWLVLCGLLSGVAQADTFHFTDGTTKSGELVSPKDTGFIIKQVDDTYTTQIPWGRLTQDDLKQLASDPKLSAFVTPFIEETPEEKRQRAQVDIKPPPRLLRPPHQSLVAAMTTSSLGLIALLLLYAANLYAGYEIAVFRNQPPALVCGLAAIAPVVGPIIFLAMPTRLTQQEEDLSAPIDENLEAAIEAEQTPTHAPIHMSTQTPGVALPPTRTFARGEFTFNRRFFETQVPGFFAVIRPGADKEIVMSVKSNRGTHVVQRISRISPNEIYVQAPKGNSYEEVLITFAEIQEVQLKHKDAA